MAAEYKTLAGVEPEDAADVSIRLKVLAGELYTVLRGGIAEAELLFADGGGRGA